MKPFHATVQMPDIASFDVSLFHSSVTWGPTAFLTWLALFPKLTFIIGLVGNHRDVVTRPS